MRCLFAISTSIVDHAAVTANGASVTGNLSFSAFISADAAALANGASLSGNLTFSTFFSTKFALIFGDRALGVQAPSFSAIKALVSARAVSVSASELLVSVRRACKATTYGCRTTATTRSKARQRELSSWLRRLSRKATGHISLRDETAKGMRSQTLAGDANHS